jgi:hypothetical protein
MPSKQPRTGHKTGERFDLNWDRIREDFEASPNANFTSFARKYNTTRASIRAHAKADGWVAAKNAPPQQPASNADVIDMQARKTILALVQGKKDATAHLTPDETLNQIADAIAQHTLLEGELLAYARRLLSRATKNELRPGRQTGEAEEARSVMTAIQTALELSRELRGLRPGTPSVGDGDISRDPDIHFVLPDLTENTAS